jgi:NitT/TauT family transport system ATP-binding protein
MIQIKGICKKYKNDYLFENFYIHFNKDKVTTLLGPSGCGKTTLLRILAGLESYQKGEIIGTEHKKIAYMFQEDRLIPWMNVTDNIKFVLKSYMSEEQMVRKIDEVLSILKLSDYGDYMPGELSGGMQRRAAIGRALAYESQILLMDEPFKGLDTHLKDEIFISLKEMLQKQPKTVICVTHDVIEADKLSDYIYNWETLSIKSDGLDRVQSGDAYENK